jgi:excisionase family DNA binding protein
MPTPTVSLPLPDRALLTVKDVAAALDCHPNTIRRAVKTGALYSVRVGRHVRIPRPAIEMYLFHVESGIAS